MARSTGPSRPHGGSRLAASADADEPVPEAQLLLPDHRCSPSSACCRLILEPFWLGLLGDRRRRSPSCSSSYTLVTGEGGMLWLCQITFAGVGALATAQFATEHGWPVLLARDRRRRDRRRRIGIIIGAAHDPARQPLHRAGHADLRAADGTPRVHPEGLLPVRRRRRGRPARVRAPPTRAFTYLTLGGLRGLRHPHREPPTVDHRPRARTRCAGARPRRARWA